MTQLAFQLNVEDGWPPVPVEVLPCTPIGKNYRIDSAPLFIQGLSMYDVISASPDSENRIWDWCHCSKSDRTTIWISRLEVTAQPIVDSLLSKLRALGCNITSAPALGCFAVDVPGTCSIKVVDACLDSVDEELVAVAFPSFRHDN